jgi:hypothetical protein
MYTHLGESNAATSGWCKAQVESGVLDPGARGKNARLNAFRRFPAQSDPPQSVLGK